MARPDFRAHFRIWVVPFAWLLGAAALVFGGARLYDVGLPRLLHGLLSRSPDAVLEALSASTQLIMGVLGVAITVVSIVVQLAATRYTPRVTELFFKDPINLAVLSIYIVGGLHALWSLAGFDEQNPPVAAAWMGLALMTAGVLLLLPYFSYVFYFVDPLRILRRMRDRAVDGFHGVVGATDAAAVHEARAAAVEAVEEIADVAMNAVGNKDKGLSMEAVNALGHLLREYLKVEPRLPASWFEVSADAGHDPDFVSMPQSVMEELARQRLVFEMKVLRQYQTLYNEALGKVRDINLLVAIEVRRVVETALEVKDHRVLALCVKFFNTFLRATLNAKDVRTAYNVLNQYRILAEVMLRAGKTDAALEVAGYFKYYGQLAQTMGLAFILETCAYDLCALNELAFDLESPVRDAVLAVFLDVDREAEGASDQALRGVRKAQVKLATYYLARGAEPLARRIYDDMKGERPERLRSIRQELHDVKTADFWEVIDRGQNFDYLTPERKSQLDVFFGWFPGILPQAQAVTPAA